MIIRDGNMHVQMKFSFEWNNRENDVFVRTLVVLLGIVCGCCLVSAIFAQQFTMQYIVISTD